MTITTLASSDLNAWTQGNNDVTAEGPILEIPAGINSVAASQFRDGAATKYTVRAQAGAECLGNISNLASIATLDFGGADLYFRKPNISFENIYIRWYDHKTASDDYSNLSFTNCVVDAHQDVDNPCAGGVSFTNCVILLTTGNIEDGGKTQVLYAKGSVPLTLLQCTVINKAGSTNGSVGIIADDSTGDVNINQTVGYSPSISTASTNGLGQYLGDNNASTNDTLPGVNSISGVTNEIFMDYDAGDYRIKPESLTTIGSLAANPAGAFVIEPINVDPVKDSEVTDQSFVFGTTGSYDIGQHFSDANLTDTLVFSLDNTLPSGVTLTSAGILEWTGTTNITASSNFTVTASDGHGGTYPTSTFALEITDIVPAIVNINTTDIVQPGNSYVITTVKMDIAPTTQVALLNGEALTITAWVADSVTVTIPLHVDVEWGVTHTLTLQDDNRTTALSGVKLDVPTGWSIIAYDGTVLDEIATESYFEEAKKDADVGNFTMVAGDVLAYEDSTGLTVDERTYPSVSPPSSVTGSYKIWDVSSSTWTTVSVYTWTDAGAPVPLAPSFSGPISDLVGETTDVVSFNVATFFTEYPTSFSLATGTLPAGLSLDTSTGFITGTLTGAATLTGISVTATNVTGSDTTNTFGWTVTTKIIPVVKGVLRDWDTNIVRSSLTGLKMQVRTTFSGDMLGTEVIFTTDGTGAFEVTSGDLVVGTEYFCTMSNADESITELHKIIAEAQ